MEDSYQNSPCKPRSFRLSQLPDAQKSSLHQVSERALLSTNNWEAVVDEIMITPELVTEWVFYTAAQGAPVEILQKMLKMNPALAKPSHTAPIHAACALNPYPEAVKFMMRQFIHDFTKVDDQNGNTPIGLAMTRDVDVDNARIFFTVLTFFIKNVDKESRHKIAHEDDIFDAIIRFSKEFDTDQLSDIELAQNTFRLFLHDLDGKHNPHYDVGDLLHLPVFLKEVSVQSVWVQQLVNKRISSRFHSFMLMLDIILMTVLIAVYRQAAYDSIIGAGVPLVQLHIMAGIAVYHILREGSQIMDAVTHLEEFESWNIVDFLRITLILASVATFHVAKDDYVGDNDPDSFLRRIIIATTGVLWLSVLKFLKNILMPFAVFCHSLTRIIRDLIPFMSCLVVVLIAFSQSFYSNFQGTEVCQDVDDNDYANDFCSWSDSYLKVYDMMQNPDLTDFDSITGKILYISFTFAIVIALLNVLIGIVCNTYDQLAEKGGHTVFWLNRLVMVNELDGLKRNLRYFFCCQFYFSPTKQKERMQVHYIDGYDLGGGRAIWEILMVSFENVNYNFRKRLRIVEKYKEAGLQLYLDHRLDSKNDPPVFARFVGIQVIPIWFFLGLVTLGLLWPPQVRSWMFCPDVKEDLLCVDDEDEDVEDDNDDEMMTVVNVKSKEDKEIVKAVAELREQNQQVMVKLNNIADMSSQGQDQREMREAMGGISKQLTTLESQSQNGDYHLKIEKIGEDLDGLSYEIGTFKSAVVEHLYTKVGNIETQNSGIAVAGKRRSDRLEHKFNSISSEVDKLKTEVRGIKSDIRLILEAVNDISQRVTSE